MELEARLHRCLGINGQYILSGNLAIKNVGKREGKESNNPQKSGSQRKM